MNHRTRKLTCFCFIAAIATAVSLADEPTQNGAVPVDLPQVATPAEQQIRNALEGKSNGPTGDGVLDDVLGLIKNQGSILDGSVLDNKTELNSSPQTAIDRSADIEIDRRARVAEELLRTARLLIEVGPVDQARAELVASMRREAIRLLTE